MKKQKNARQGRAKVYELGFKGGEKYIGHTKQAVSKRVKQHRSNAKTHNEELQALLNQEKPKVKVLGEYPSRAAAQRCERAAIRDAEKKIGKKLLNKSNNNKK